MSPEVKKFKNGIYKFNLYVLFVLGGTVVIFYITKRLFLLINFFGFDLLNFITKFLGDNTFKILQVFIFLVLLPIILCFLNDWINGIIKHNKHNSIFLIIMSLLLLPVYATQFILSIIAITGK